MSVNCTDRQGIPDNEKSAAKLDCTVISSRDASPFLITTIRFGCKFYHSVEGDLDVGQVHLIEVVEICVSSFPEKKSVSQIKRDETSSQAT